MEKCSPKKWKNAPNKMLYRRQAIERTMLSNSKQHSQMKIQVDIAKATTEQCKHDSVARRILIMRTKDILLIQMME